ncbi:MAG: acetyltransferase [Desulfobulbaceae bacterium]|nr:acetyltransferase [Desulfobulbaceae bacterium]
MKPDIILIGGGGHCKSCIDVIEQENKYAIAGIVDKPEKKGHKVLGCPISACDEDLPDLARQFQFLITLGQIQSAEKRTRLYRELKEYGATLPTIISPRAYVSPHAEIGQGTIVMHGATVNAGARVGVNCIINSHALIEHDAIIHDHCHISTGAIINGGVEIGEQTFIGSRTMTREYITIGAGSFIAGGMSIYQDLPEQSRVKSK